MENMINYDALTALVNQIESGDGFSMATLRQAFGDVVDDAIDAENLEAQLLVVG